MPLHQNDTIAAPRWFSWRHDSPSPYLFAGLLMAAAIVALLLPMSQ